MEERTVISNKYDLAQAIKVHKFNNFRLQASAVQFCPLYIYIYIYYIVGFPTQLIYIYIYIYPLVVL